MPTPSNFGNISPEERKAALAKAQAVRSERAKYLDKIRKGEKSPIEALNEMPDDPTVGRVRVKSFLRAVPGFGKVKTKKVMCDIGIADERRMVGLGSRQKEELEKLFSEK